jgi:hypothetical protein
MGRKRPFFGQKYLKTVSDRHNAMISIAQSPPGHRKTLKTMHELNRSTYGPAQTNAENTDDDMQLPANTNGLKE